MGRLEHACGPALVSHPLTLELDLTAVTQWDSAARALIERLAVRGATLTAPTEPPSVVPATLGLIRHRSRYRRAAKTAKPAINSK